MFPLETAMAIRYGDFMAPIEYWKDSNQSINKAIFIVDKSKKY